MTKWFPGPSIAEERAEAVRHLVPGAPETPWRHHGLLLRAVFTVLAVMATAAAFGFFALLRLPPKGIITAILAIGTAEWLIREHRSARTSARPSRALPTGGGHARSRGLQRASATPRR